MIFVRLVKSIKKRLERSFIGVTGFETFSENPADTPYYQLEREIHIPDAQVDELADFIKTDRQCCDFFDFSLKVSGKGAHAWLTITGPKGANDFIHSELGL